MRLLKLSIISLILTFFFINTNSFAFSNEIKLQKLEQIKKLKKQGKTVYAIVPKYVDEDFFKLTGKGCEETAKKLGVYCIFYGSKVQNVRNQEKDILDLIKVNIDGIAVSSVKKGYLELTIGKKIKKWGKPLISYDSPLSSNISKTYVGTNNYLLGKALGERIRDLKPNGGNYCIQTERIDSPNLNKRMKGIIDGMTNNGKDSSKWKNIFRCPLKSDGDFKRSLKQMKSVLNSYKVDVFASTTTGSQNIPKTYKEILTPYKEKLNTGELIYASIDTTAVQLEHIKNGFSTVNVGQRPYDMGKKSLEALVKLSEGKSVSKVIYTGLTYCTKNNLENCTTPLKK